jgi:hypothetical protein
LLLEYILGFWAIWQQILCAPGIIRKKHFGLWQFEEDFDIIVESKGLASSLV